MDIRVVLVEPEHDGNIGLIARAIKNFGHYDFWLVRPKARLTQEATALASHAQDILKNARLVSNLDDALRDCDYAIATTAIVGKSTSNLGRKSLTIREFAQRAADINMKAAIVFGRESKGLTNAEIERCDLVVTIPTSADYVTLNIAMAVSIALYELQITKGENSSFFERASREARLRLINTFEELSKEVCLPAYRISLAKKALGNVISRGFISEREASLIVGVIRKAVDGTRLEKKRTRENSQ